MFEPILHPCGNRTWVLEFEHCLFVMDPGFDCEHLDKINFNPDDSPTLSRICRIIETTHKPLTHLLISHHHYDHARNLPWFLAMSERHPDHFPFQIIIHENHHLKQAELLDILYISGDQKITIDNEELWILSVPGHTSSHDDIALWFPRESLLFAGDLIQPQGSDYSNCTFCTPVSNHKLSSLVMKSLEKVHNLPFRVLLMGHDSQIFDSLEGINAIEVTYSVLEREKELAKNLIQDFPGEEMETYAEIIFDTICRERGLSTQQAEIRKTQGHSGECQRMAPESFYHLYDLPSIRSFVLEEIRRN
jgi:glyoxylase-like metal-dependent hydrolase (beta-lactamase superfamily II)